MQISRLNKLVSLDLSECWIDWEKVALQFSAYVLTFKHLRVSLVDLHRLLICVNLSI